jgi:hypothetical protein
LVLYAAYSGTTKVNTAANNHGGTNEKTSIFARRRLALFGARPFNILAKAITPHVLQSNCALEKQAKVPVCETVHLQVTGCGFKKYINKTCAIKMTVATVVIVLSFLPCGAIRPPPAYKLMANAVLLYPPINLISPFDVRTKHAGEDRCVSGNASLNPVGRLLRSAIYS